MNIILDYTTSLVLTAANGVVATVHYADYTASGAVVPDRVLTALTGAGETQICGAPAAGVKRVIKSLTIFNNSGGQVSYTLGLKVSSTVYPIKKNATFAADADYSF